MAQEQKDMRFPRVEPKDADAFVAIVFAPKNEIDLPHPEIWPVRRNQPIRLGKSTVIIVADDAEDDPKNDLVPFRITVNTDGKVHASIIGNKVVALFREMPSARAWAADAYDCLAATAT